MFDTELLFHLTLFGLESTLVLGLLMVLFHLRARIGLAPLFLAIGALQYPQIVLAVSTYVEVPPGLTVSPGSIVLFPASLFTVLLVYLREDAGEVRRLIFGVVIANLTLALLTAVLGWHLQDTAARNPFGIPTDLSFVDLRLTVVGTLAFVLDAALIVVLYEAMSHVLPRSIFLRVATTMLLVVTFDSLIFMSGSFFDATGFSRLLVSALAGKAVTCVFFASVLSVYLHRFRPGELQSELIAAEHRDIFDLMTYRQKYRVVREQLQRDPLTGLFNRGFFEEFLELELARSRREGLATSLLMVDVDHFKRINDRYGHRRGDQVLQAIAETLQSCLRKGDAACRYGGEEFAVVAHDADPEVANALAERIREHIAAGSDEQAIAPSALPTVTIGVASCPHHANTVEDLVELADRQLYRGKWAGRNRVVAQEASGF